MTRATRLSSRRHPRRATAATELALVLPLLMTLILGCVDFGRIAYFYCAVSNASRTAAEYGSTHNFTAITRATWHSRVEQAATAELTPLPNFDPSQLSVAVDTATDAYGLFRVTVDVQYPFQTVVPWPGLPQSVTLWRSTSMRQIR